VRASLWKISTFALASALTLVVGNGVVGSASAEPQPRMYAALEHLKHARIDLQQAPDNKGGHRARAIELLNRAIDETKLGIAYGKK
jgi:hypothetical protein